MKETDIKEIRARVILQEKGLYTLSYEGEEKRAEVSGKFRYEAATVSDYPAVGDYVTASWPSDGSNAIISGLFPRKSVFIRKAAGDRYQEQVVAANVDTVFLCMSLNKNYNLRRLERYLAIAWDSGSVPVVVLTKSDLCDDVDGMVAEVSAAAGGVDIITASSVNDETDQVKACLTSGKTYAFLGSSGVGKSTLINKLKGTDSIRTSETGADDRGRHTTTHRELLELENGAFVIDTPGMKELGLWDNDEGIDEVFSDIEELALKCRFSDCSHTNEPGCAILTAISEGNLSPERFSAYLKLKTENAYTADQSGYLQKKKEKFKMIAKANKGFRKNLQTGGRT